MEDIFGGVNLVMLLTYIIIKKWNFGTDRS